MKYLLILVLAMFTLALSCRTEKQEHPESLADFIAGIDAPGARDEAPEHRPWTRWWWLGNIVDTAGITSELEAYAAAGIGGVEITPLYGVKGYEDQYIDHLSPLWQEMLSHTIAVAGRLGLGVDMNLGTGWPFGGPQVENEFAAGKLEYERLAKAGEYSIFCGKTGQHVKRAAPGGEGYTLDHFSSAALEDYLEPYDTAITIPGKGLRAVFNDSYEVYGADYTPDFPEAFLQRRKYDFRDYLVDLFERKDSAVYSRLLCDFRETLSDLLLEDFAISWNRWSNEKGFLTRYQAHGSPGNLLDLYAAASIPECEIFGAPEFAIPGYTRDSLMVREGDDDPMMQKFCSSAAHLQGNELVSSETFTWLREHFRTSLAHCKPLADKLFLNGITHIFLHGSTYSPTDESWPGFKFYASVNFHPGNSIWHDAPFLFEYIRRCQHILQQTETDHQVLLYWPFHDVLSMAGRENLLLQLSVHNVNEWLENTSFYRMAGRLDSLGIGYDIVSDRFLEKIDVTKGMLSVSGKSHYRVIVVPESQHLPIESMEKLLELKKKGGAVVFAGLPETVPGLYRFRERENRLKQLLNEFSPEVTPAGTMEDVLKRNGIIAERDLAVSSLKILKKRRDGNAVYFLANHSPHTIHQWFTFMEDGSMALLYDPMTGTYGSGDIRVHDDSLEVWLHMQPGQTLFLFMDNPEGEGKDDASVSGNNSWQAMTKPWKYTSGEANAEVEFGTWKVEFLNGGPSLPGVLLMEHPGAWTGHGDDYDAFAGTGVYSTTFTLGDAPDGVAEGMILDLEEVRESARIRINGKVAGTLIAHPFRIDISEHLRVGENTMEIEVTNLSANRIRALERSGTVWKKFYDINMVNIHYSPFDAASWEVMPSGLNGDVRLLRVNYK